MARWYTIFIISVLLLSASEGRSLLSSTSPDSSSERPVSSSHITASLDQTWLNGDGDACKGLDKTQCVVKRTMVAHTDYVYTQDINGP
ncbi:phytosulfokines-like [Lotus japonicus]|uniref:phytosulfokines-like n=1 Tax=Lotus japonicus TaxID=34305 RepID=UPI002585D869|nr:phytosulfokines-like [Lotus japonicus]